MLCSWPYRIMNLIIRMTWPHFMNEWSVNVGSVWLWTLSMTNVNHVDNVNNNSMRLLGSLVFPWKRPSLWRCANTYKTTLVHKINPKTSLSLSNLIEYYKFFTVTGASSHKVPPKPAGPPGKAMSTEPPLSELQSRHAKLKAVWKKPPPAPPAT